MQLIEAFYYALKMEANDFLKTQKDVDKKLDDTTEKMNVQEKEATKLGTSFMDLAKKTAGLVAAYASWTAIKGAALQAADDTNKLADQARSMYLSADELRTWQGAVVSAGGTAEGLNSTLKMLAERTRDPLGALERVADRFKGLTDRQADQLGKSLGIDQSMVDVLRLGTAGLQDRIRAQMRLGEVTKEQLEIARKYKLVLADTNVVFDDVRRRIMALVLPAITEWMQVMQKLVIWVREHGVFVGTFFTVIATAITTALLPALIRLGVAWARTSLAFLATPLGMFIAILLAVAAAIALIVDDIAAFEAGGKSLIGDIAARWPIVGDIVHNIVDALKMLWEIGRAVFQYLKDVIYEPATALDNLHKRLSVVFDAMEKRFPLLATVVKAVSRQISDFVQGVIDIFTGLFDIVAKVFNFIKDSFVGDALKWAGGKIVDTVVNSEIGKEAMAKSDGNRYELPSDEQLAKQRKEVAATAKAGSEQAASTIQAGKQAVQQADKNPVNSMTSNSITNSSITNRPTQTKNTNVQTGPITIQTQATDGAAVGAAVGKGLQDQMKQANDEFDNGVAI